MLVKIEAQQRHRDLRGRVPEIVDQGIPAQDVPRCSARQCFRTDGQAAHIRAVEHKVRAASSGRKRADTGRQRRCAGQNRLLQRAIARSQVLARKDLVQNARIKSAKSPSDAPNADQRPAYIQREAELSLKATGFWARVTFA